jgi:hypothetical protein
LLTSKVQALVFKANTDIVVSKQVQQRSKLTLVADAELKPVNQRSGFELSIFSGAVDVSIPAPIFPHLTQKFEIVRGK